MRESRLPESQAALSDLLPLESGSSVETEAAGRRLAGELTPGTVVALYGELGAGKTVLVKGICAGFGIDARAVSSPTFTLLHEYAGTVPVFHFDAYRIRSAEEFFDLGYEDYFFDAGITVVEWADRIEPLLPEQALRIELVHLDDHRRRIALRTGA